MSSLSKTVKEVMFMIPLLRSMKIFKLSVTVSVDNVGTIFMMSNITTKSYTIEYYTHNLYNPNK